MKGYLTWHSRVFRKTHNLTDLGRMCTSVDPSLEPTLGPAARLTDYAWKYRYPGEPDEPSREEAESALGLAKEVYDAVLGRLPEEVRPANRPVDANRA
jgi:HEPN domain-containing protein